MILNRLRWWSRGLFTMQQCARISFRAKPYLVPAPGCSMLLNLEIISCHLAPRLETSSVAVITIHSLADEILQLALPCVMLLIRRTVLSTAPLPEPAMFQLVPGSTLLHQTHRLPHRLFECYRIVAIKIADACRICYDPGWQFKRSRRIF